jgi:flavin reductase (DIM6/NTAB) family NADH-FMN oxidoreductase RutF
MKITKKPATALFPCPVVLVTCGDSREVPNIITLAWVGVICSTPPIIGLGIRPERHSYELIEQLGEFVVNIPTTEIVRIVDFCGVVSGRSCEKFGETGLTAVKADRVKTPLIEECPINIECKVRQIIPLGSHHLFLGEVIQYHVEETILDDQNNIDFTKIAPFVYNRGEYWSLGQKIGKHGFSKP